MSLLMQALRKAESAKKEQGAAPEAAAAPVAEPLAAPTTGELTLELKEPTREEIATAKQIAAETAAEPIPVPAQPKADSVDYFSSETPPVRTPYIPPEPASEALAPRAQGFDPDRGFEAAPAVPPAPAAPAAPPPVTPAPRLQVGLEKKQEADEAERKALEARNAASAVFAAKQRAGRNQRPLILAACGLLLLSAAGAYGYYQFMSISQPQPLDLPQPVPPLGIPAAPAPDVAAAPAVQAGAVPAVPVPPAAPVTPATAVAAAPAAPLPATPAKAPSPAPGPASRPDAAARPRASAPVQSRAPAGAGGIELRRDDVAQKVNPALTGAYQSFMAGDTDAARSQYQRVLQQEPDNRDALLGMAAIAVKRGQSGEAGSFYARLVELDPTDAEAASGLASVQRIDPGQAESNLKKVLAASPQTGSAHFALGNLYAQQQRWSEAQQAYFQAVGAAPANADYAFNLAVSLDRLGQKKLALENYQRALQLSEAGSNVNRGTVQIRVNQLQDEIAAAPR